MADVFMDLAEAAGGYDKIKPAELYPELIKRKGGFIKQIQTYGLESLRNSNIGKEVDRRCKTDLLWLAGFWTWETNPVGAGQPISENKVTESEYKIVCDFFVQKDPGRSIPQQDTIKTRQLLWPRGGL